MKNPIVIILIASLFILGACSNKSTITTLSKNDTSINNTSKQSQKKENPNELVYKVDGQEKTVKTTDQTIGSIGKTMKMPDNFTITENGTSTEIHIQGNDVFNITVDTKSMEKFVYKSLLTGSKAKNIQEPKKIGYPNIDKNFNYIITGYDPEMRVIRLVKNPGQENETLDVGISIPNEIYSKDLEEESLAMVDSMFNN